MREFAEPFRHGWRQAVEVRATLVDIQSPFQRIQVLDTVPFGRMLVLDDAAQTAETEEYVYHEMLVHVPLLAHPDPRRVLIIGGGDGGALRRVLAHPVTLARQVEIDGEVVRVSRELLPSISAGAYDDPRADAVIGDGVAHLRDTTERYDVLLIDSTDPVGPAVELFGDAFYRDARRALGGTGLLVTQSGSPLVMLDELKAARALLARHFPIVRTYVCSIPAYPGVLWSFTAASEAIDPARIDLAVARSRLRALGVPTGYYTPAVHAAAFALPNFLRAALEMEDDGDPPALSPPVSG